MCKDKPCCKERTLWGDDDKVWMRYSEEAMQGKIFSLYHFDH